MMDPDINLPSPDEDTTDSNHIEMPDVHVSKSNVAAPTSTTLGTMFESSMDIEQSVPTVAEMRGKSDNEDMPPPPVRRGKVFYGMLALPFLVVALIVTIVVAVTTNKNSSQNNSNSLKNLGQEESFNTVVQYLGDHDISEYPELIREGSFQNQAAKWMAHDDPAHRRMPEGSPDSTEGYIFMQRYLMVLVYYQMGGDSSWTYDLNFLSEKDTCEWFAWLVGDTSSHAMGARCNQDMLVSALIMVGAGVKGSFPEELSKLTSLRIIELDVNDISGSLPKSFDQLLNLESIHLSHNDITGELPSYLGTFPNLLTIDVSFNLMDGTLPTELATMDKLRGAALDHNLFSGNLGFWGKFSKATAAYKQDNLQYIFLEQNALTGLVETTMIQKLPNLKVFDVSDNKLTGPIAVDLFHISSLQVLDLHDNAFTGQLPHGMNRNTALEFLAVQSNQLTGTISETIGNLQMLRHFDCSNNKIIDYETNTTSNAGISSLKNLTYLFLSANDFEAAPFPFWVRGMTNLEELSLKSLSMDGPIPTWIGELTSLVLLDLDDNDLRGAIPSEIGNLNKLQFLLLNRNELTETIPAELESISSLRLLYLDKNEVEGNLNAFCERPPSARSPIMIADCGGDSPEIGCECCQICCIDSEKCNDDNIVPSNDPLWQFGYDRLFYTFGNGTGYFMSTP